VTTTAPELVPFGMRYAARQTSTPPGTDGVTYDRDLQIAVSADGNPWSEMGKNETSSNTNSDSKNDEGTDFY
jgi:putative ATP-grasp target RiPP